MPPPSPGVVLSGPRAAVLARGGGRGSVGAPAGLKPVASRSSPSSRWRLLRVRWVCSARLADGVEPRLHVCRRWHRAGAAGMGSGRRAEPEPGRCQPAPLCLATPGGISRYRFLPKSHGTGKVPEEGEALPAAAKAAAAGEAASGYLSKEANKGVGGTWCPQKTLTQLPLERSPQGPPWPPSSLPSPPGDDPPGPFPR